MILDEEKETIEKLSDQLYYDVHKITQNKFDNIVNHIIKNKNAYDNYKELLFRLCGCYEECNYETVIDEFINIKDDYYLSELICYVDNINQEYLVKKMIDTKDINFIRKSLSNSGNAMEYYLDKDNINILKEYIVNSEV